MGPLTMIAIYVVCWWTVLFAVLPLGARTHAELGLEHPKDGGDPGAPVNIDLKRKFITTTWVSAIVWVIVLLVIWSGVIPMPSAPPV